MGRFAGKTALMIGASQGIGLSTARQFAQEGGSAALVARRPGPLEAAADEVRGDAGSEQWVEALPADAAAEDSIRQVVESLIDRRGVPDYLFNFAGGAYPAYVTDLRPSDLRSQMETNYFTQAVPALLLAPYFIARGRGHFGFTSSMMGYFAIIGYAAYAPAKFAVAGFAEALRHELKPDGIQVSILYPPDTDTPGLVQENGTKPPETAKLSEGAGLLTPEEVASTFLDGVAHGKLNIHPKGSGLPWRLQRYAPGALRAYLDFELRRVRKKADK